MIVVVGAGTLGVRVLRALPLNKEVTVIDHDIVQAKNVPVQYPQEAVGMRKVDAVRALIRPDCTVYAKYLDYTTVGLLAEADLVIDCTDTMVSRLLINDYCAQQGIPWVHGALSDVAGTVAVFTPGKPCFRCIYGGNPGELCTPALLPEIADKTAYVVVQEAQTALAHAVHSIFVRVHAGAHVVLQPTFDPNCPTCHGEYPALHPQESFYITYCVNNNCMAAKPRARHDHDHGSPQLRTIQGIPVQVFPNGELHFLAEVDADVLHSIAKRVYAERKNI